MKVRLYCEHLDEVSAPPRRTCTPSRRPWRATPAPHRKHLRGLRAPRRCARAQVRETSLEATMRRLMGGDAAEAQPEVAARIALDDFIVPDGDVEPGPRRAK
eukprot:5848510-Prymnesium_polylepis.1